MVLDQAGPAGQLQDLVVADGEAVAVLGRHRDVLGHLAAANVVDQLEFLGADQLLEDRPETLLHRRLEDVILVGIDRPLNHVLAQAIRGVDQHGVTEPGFGIDRKHHAGDGQVRPHHALDADRQTDLEVVEPLVHAVGNGPIGVKRGEAALAGLEQGLAALDVQVGFLLPGEAGVGQVFGGGAAAHGDVERLGGPLRELLIGGVMACCRSWGRSASRIRSRA